MAAFNNSFNATSMYLAESTLKSTSFFTTSESTEPGYSSIWNILSTDEANGWNTMFIIVCIFIVYCCFCGVAIHLFQSRKPKEHSSRKGTFDIHSIPLYDDSYENKELTRVYRYDVKFPFYYYCIKFTQHFSVLVQYVFIIYCMDDTLYNQMYVYVLLYSYLFANVFFNIYGFCHMFMLLSQTVFFLLLCNLSKFALIVYCSIFTFQIAAQFIVGIINEDICDFKQCRKQSIDGNNKLLIKYIFENVRFGLLFNNYELLPLLVYVWMNAADAIVSDGMEMKETHYLWHKYESDWYHFSIVFVVWLSSLSPVYILYMLRFGLYFNPQKHVNHFLIAFYFRLYVIVSVIFKCINIYMCMHVILSTDWYSNVWTFEFCYAMFLAIWNLVLLLMFPLCLYGFNNCCCGELRACCYWFVRCKTLQRQ